VERRADAIISVVNTLENVFKSAVLPFLRSLICDRGVFGYWLRRANPNCNPTMPSRPPFDPMLIIDQLAELGRGRRHGVDEVVEGMVTKLRKIEAEKENELRAAMAMLKAYEEEAEELRKVEEARERLRAREIAARAKRVAAVAAAQAA
jgi:hypothetical protein